MVIFCRPGSLPGTVEQNMNESFFNDEAARILVTGITSIHGWPIFQKISALVSSDRVFGLRPPGMSIPDGPAVMPLCMTDLDGMMRIKREFRPTHVVHAAGVCDLDSCEANPRFAHDINVTGARNVVSAFTETCYIMYLSADLVFSGDRTPDDGYREIDVPDPVSVVGKTFLLAEHEIGKSMRHSIVRLGLPMGKSIQGKKGAVDFIRNRLKRGLIMSLFDDEFRSCIDCADLADAVASLLSFQEEGVFHLGGPHPVSLHEIGRLILERGDYDAGALRKWSRKDDVNGPPRMGNVHLNSRKMERVLGRLIREWQY
jgi:dTDP-4-dehydrorhamnose reductase